SSDTDATELAVIPTGRPAGSRVVRTVTPVAKRPSSWRNCAGSTPGMSSPQELGQDARGKHTARRDDVPGRAHQKIREVGPRRQAAYDTVGERGPPDADPDEPLEQPLVEERLPPGARVRPQRRGGNGALTPHASAGMRQAAASSAPRSALWIPWPVNGSKKSAASPTSKAPPPGATAVRDHCAKGPVTSTSRTRHRGSKRPTRPGNRCSSSKKPVLKSRRPWRTAASGRTNATVVMPPPTGPRPT